MNSNYFTLTRNGSTFFVDCIDELKDPDSILVIAHGLAEHNERYHRISKFMSEKNIQTYIISHLGHGKNDPNTGIWPKNGFQICIENLDELVSYVKEKHTGKKVILFGHSMGSFISLGYIEKYSSKIDLCILSGTNDAQAKALSIAGSLIASLICTFSGREKPSKMLNDMSFGSFNKHFAPTKTDFDWLSKDEAEVKKYIDDDLCGFIPSAGLFKELLVGLNMIYKDQAIDSIRKDLPIHLMGGEKDPVGNFGKGLTLLQQRLTKASITKVSLTIYKDNRHECLNEVNKEQVMNDIYNLIVN